MYIAKLAKRPAHLEPATLGMNNPPYALLTGRFGPALAAALLWLLVQPLGAALLPARLARVDVTIALGGSRREASGLLCNTHV